jgi:hypothetical protein
MDWIQKTEKYFRKKDEIYNKRSKIIDDMLTKYSARSIRKLNPDEMTTKDLGLLKETLKRHVYNPESFYTNLWR